jgi:hypothetical protein
MVFQIERGQRLYIADESDRIFEGALLDVDMASGVAHLDPLARLTLDPATKTWIRTPLPRGPARSTSFATVHDEENEARHYAQHGYTSPLGEAGAWSHPSKRIWILTTGPAATETPKPTSVTVEIFTRGGRAQEAPRTKRHPGSVSK